MKRLYQLVAMAGIIALMPLAGSVPAHAAATCDVGFTGPNSQNMCMSIETYQCAVTNENIVTISNANNQTVASGQVTVSGNGSAGGASSGSVTNQNGTTFSVTITNAAADDEPGVCTATVMVPARTVVETVQPTVTTTPTTAPRALPVTSGNVAGAIIGVTAALLALATAGGVSIVAYRRQHRS